MSYEINDKVKVLAGVYYKGHNLSLKIGIVKDTTSYILVYFSDLNLTAKILQDEIEPYDEYEYSYDSDSWRWE